VPATVKRRVVRYRLAVGGTPTGLGIGARTATTVAVPATAKQYVAVPATAKQRCRTGGG